MKMLKLTIAVLAFLSAVVWGLYFAVCRVGSYSPGTIEFALVTENGNQRRIFSSAQEVRASALLLGEKEYCLWAEPILRFSNGNKVTYVEAWPIVHSIYYPGFQEYSKIKGRHPNFLKDLDAKADETEKTVDDLFRAGYRCDTFPDAKNGEQVCDKIDSYIDDVMADGFRPALVEGYFLSLMSRMSDEIVARDAIDEVLEVKKTMFRVVLKAALGK